MISKIFNWSGRNGNNVIQVINCIYFSFYKNNMSMIQIPKHILFNTTQITNKENKIIDNNRIIYRDKNNFFYSKKLGFFLTPKKMREITQKYLTEIVTINLNLPAVENTLYVHLRGGDFLTNNLPFVCMPWKYYSYIIEKYKFKNTIVVHEDNSNKCLEKFKELKNNKTQSKTVLEDIEMLCSAKNLALTVSTFDIMIFCLSKNIEEIFIPHVIINEEWYPDMDWGVKKSIIYMKNYTKNRWLKLNKEGKNNLILNYDEEIYI